MNFSTCCEAARVVLGDADTVAADAARKVHRLFVFPSVFLQTCVVPPVYGLQPVLIAGLQSSGSCCRGLAYSSGLRHCEENLSSPG